eukprot:Lankesteria_metandrocarpae@DN5443_c1_g1_i3.p1
MCFGQLTDIRFLFAVILLVSAVVIDRNIVFWTKSSFVVQLATRTGASLSFLERKPATGSGGHSGSCAFMTDVPMYYINLDRSRARRAYMEEAFSCAGNLTRVPATDAEMGQLEEYVNTGGLSKDNNWREYTDAVSATVAEVALMSSHLRAMQTAYANGDEAAIIFEDDVGIQLVPLWANTPDELLVAANEKYTDVWEVTFLHFSFVGRGSYNKYIQKSRAKPSEVLTAGSGSTYGTVAYMMNRKGMQRVINTWSDAKDRKLNCFNHNRKCVADHIIYKGMESVPNAMVFPTAPLFISRLFEDATGVRTSKFRKINDQYRQHIGFNLNSILRSVEQYELRLYGDAVQHNPDELVIDALASDNNTVTVSIYPMFDWVAIAT